MSRFEALFLTIIATILIVTLLVPPIVGLADNGDFYKMLSKFGLDHSAQTREDRYLGYVDTIYLPNPVESARHQAVWGKTLISSEMLFVAVAVHLNRLLGFQPRFCLQCLGAVHIAILLLGVFLLVIGTRGLSKPKRFIGAALFAVMFLDVAYICYFNSAYTETSSYLFLLLLIAAAAPVILRKPYYPIWLFVYFVASLLFCCSRYPNVAMFPLLALFGFVMAITSRKILSILLALIATVSGIYLAIDFVRGVPPAYTELGIYNHFFGALLPFSRSPSEDLSEFQLSQSFVTYSKTTFYEPGSAVYNADAYRQFKEKVTTQTVMKFYLRHPKRVLDGMCRAVSEGMKLHPGYGNYQKHTGMQPGTISQGFCIWNSVRESLLPKSFWVVAFVLVVSAISAIWPWNSLCTAGFRILILLLCILQLGIIACGSEPSDITRHMFLFNLLFDLTIMMTSIELLAHFSKRFLRSEVAAGADR
jgi:hypothetical protein